MAAEKLPDKEVAGSADQHEQVNLSTRLERLSAEDRSFVLDSFTAALAEGQLPPNDISLALFAVLDDFGQRNSSDTQARSEDLMPAPFAATPSVSEFVSDISDFVSVDAAAADALDEVLG